MEKKLAVISGFVSTMVVGLLAVTHDPARQASAEATMQPTPVHFTELLRGEQTSVKTRVNYLVTSENEFKRLWKMIGATSTPPAVDFTTQTVIAVFAGRDPKTEIAVAKVEDADRRLVSIIVKAPDSTCTTTQSNASPFEIVAVAATSLPFAHEDIVTTTSCSH